MNFVVFEAFPADSGSMFKPCEGEYIFQSGLGRMPQMVSIDKEQYQFDTLNIMSSVCVCTYTWMCAHMSTGVMRMTGHQKRKVVTT